MSLDSSFYIIGDSGIEFTVFTFEHIDVPRHMIGNLSLTQSATILGGRAILPLHKQENRFAIRPFL